MTSAISFGVSAILLIGLFALHAAELRRGKRYAHTFRKRLDRGAVVVWRFVIKTVPRILAQFARYVIIHITDLFSSSLLRIVRFIEHRLHRFVHVVKGKKYVSLDRESSTFLRYVSLHKKEIQNDRPENLEQH